MAKPVKILVIDDDRVLVDATKTVLESRNYQVVAAYDGDEGLKKAKEEKPDLIILDIIMPTKDGFKVCEQIKGNPEIADIPVLIMTSFASQKGTSNIPVSAGFGLEAEGYIDKPVSPADLLSRVEKMLKTK
ncbi:MAG: response regulator [Chloroflexi bacterium]|nr:response regulator [Chloroflexota bacterium]